MDDRDKATIGIDELRIRARMSTYADSESFREQMKFFLWIAGFSVAGEAIISARMGKTVENSKFVSSDLAFWLAVSTAGVLTVVDQLTRDSRIAPPALVAKAPGDIVRRVAELAGGFFCCHPENLSTPPSAIVRSGFDHAQSFPIICSRL